MPIKFQELMQYQ